MMADSYARGSNPTVSFDWAAVVAMSQPEDMDINEILFRPTLQVR